MIIFKARWRKIVVIIPIFALGMLYWRNHESRFIQRFFSEPASARPSREAFVGRWKLEEASYPSVERRMGKRPITSCLDLDFDGRLITTNMPIQDAFIKPEFQLLSKEGAWGFELKQVWMLSAVFGKDRYVLSIEWEGDRPVALVDPVPDADSSERWVWRKVP